MKQVKIDVLVITLGNKRLAVITYNTHSLHSAHSVAFAVKDCSEQTTFHKKRHINAQKNLLKITAILPGNSVT